MWYEPILERGLLPDAALRHGIRQTVSRAFWERLHTAEPCLDLEAGDVDPTSVSLGALSGAAA